MRQPAKRREGRYGALFGETVHRAIGLAMRDPSRAVKEVVGLVARQTGLSDRLDAAERDVTNALGALRAEGLLRPLGPTLRLEYPVVGTKEDGTMLVGYVDLVSASEGRMDVIDFKTDQAPTVNPREEYPEYVRQVRIYGKMLEAAGICEASSLRCGLLFTAETCVWWV